MLTEPFLVSSTGRACCGRGIASALALPLQGPLPTGNGVVKKVPTGFDGARVPPKELRSQAISEEQFVSSKQMQAGSHLSSSDGPLSPGSRCGLVLGKHPASVQPFQH